MADKYRYHEDGTLPTDGRTIFVFGSNLAGRHGKGAALVARRSFGAQYGNGEGPQGWSYAIPTKDEKLRVLHLSHITRSIEEFREHTKRNKHETYFVTRVGCGLAGFNDKTIALRFRGATRRCSFPIQWKEWLE